MKLKMKLTRALSRLNVMSYLLLERELGVGSRG
jgi:hypothetical protein